jgi:hypothetical protein
VGDWFLHFRVFLSIHISFLGGFLGVLLDVKMGLLRVLLTVERFDFFVEILGFLHQRTALFGIVLGGIQIFSRVLMVEFVAVRFMVLLVELLR